MSKSATTTDRLPPIHPGEVLAAEFDTFVLGGRDQRAHRNALADTDIGRPADQLSVVGRIVEAKLLGHP